MISIFKVPHPALDVSVPVGPCQNGIMSSRIAASVCTRLAVAATMVAAGITVPPPADVAAATMAAAQTPVSHRGEESENLAVWPASKKQVIRAGAKTRPSPRNQPLPGPFTRVPERAAEGIPSGSTRDLTYALFDQTGSQIATASHVRVSRPEVEPFSAHGKLLVRFAGAQAGCSGTVINTPNESTVITAAHCVREGLGVFGRWATRVAFVPAYDRGRRPFGTFLAAKMWVPAQYWQFENPNYDVAVIRLRANAYGRVAKVVGARGWSTGVSRYHRYKVFGYPAGALAGEVPRRCISRVHGVREVARYLPGPVPSRIVCDMARGSSGGGWIYGGGYLNSVIGYANIGRPGILYGPYFGAEVRRLIRRVGG